MNGLGGRTIGAGRAEAQGAKVEEPVVVTQVTERYGSIDLLAQNRDQAQMDLAIRIQNLDNLSRPAAEDKAARMFRLFEGIQNGQATDQETNLPIQVALNRILLTRSFEANTGVEQLDLLIRRANLTINSQHTGQEERYDLATRCTLITENPYLLAIIRMPELEGAELRGLLDILWNSPLERVSSGIQGWERQNEHLGLGNEVAGAVERIDAYNMGMRNQDANLEDILAALRSTSQEEFEKYARRFLTDIQMAQILQRAQDIAEAASPGVEAGSIMQENIKMAVDILFMLMEQSNLSEIVAEENRKKDSEKYASIAERMPEGLLREIGDSPDAIEFMEILSGATSLSPEKAAERMESLIAGNAEIREGLASFLVG